MKTHLPEIQKETVDGSWTDRKENRFFLKNHKGCSK